MTPSDLDLETRLRDQRTRAEEIPPAPLDLVARVRVRAREQRRRRIALTAAGVAAALVFVGVPVLASGLTSGETRDESAAPSSRRPSFTYLPPLSDVPTRGSLAGDEEWLAEVLELSWRSPALESALPPDVVDQVLDPAVETRHVAFAGDVPGGRAALVVGPDDVGSLANAWFVGPEGADPEDLTLATFPSLASARMPVALWATPDPASNAQVIIVVGHPGDEMEVLTGREVTAAGETRDLWQTIPMENGAGAVTPDRPFSWPYGSEFRVSRSDRAQPVHPALTYGNELFSGTLEPFDVADPRGLREVVDALALQWAVESLIASYGLPAEQLGPTLLAGGPVGPAPAGGPAGPGSTTSAVLVGVTFPSGATITNLVVSWGGAEGMTSMAVQPDPAPAGTALLDRVLAVATTNALAVSGPAAGVTAEAYRADGTLLATVPLTKGAGVTPLSPPSPSIPRLDTVRILDAGGGLLAEVRVEEG